MKNRNVNVVEILLVAAALLSSGCGREGCLASKERIRIETNIVSAVRSAFEAPARRFSEAESAFKNALKDGMNSLSNKEDRAVALRGACDVFTNIVLERPDYRDEYCMAEKFLRLNLVMSEAVWRNTGDPERVVTFWETLRKRLDGEVRRCGREYEKAKRERKWIRKTDYDNLMFFYGPIMLRDSTNLVIADEMIKYAFFNYSRERFQSLSKRLGKALDYKPERDFDILELNYPQFKHKLEGMVYGLQVVTNNPTEKGH